MRQLLLGHEACHVFPSDSLLVDYLAKEIRMAAITAQKEGRHYSIALSGGSTPKALYKRLAETDIASDLPWKSVYLFLGDERCVAETDNDSNYKMVRLALLDHVGIPPENVFRPLEKFEATTSSGSAPALDSAQAALDYERRIAATFSLKPGEFPKFDLVLLGLGPDGHTASLFPESKALNERERIYVENRVEQMQSWRLTLTFPAIAAAHRIVFLVCGEGKADILAQVIEGRQKGITKFPSQNVKAKDGQLFWYVDEQAAVNLDRAVKKG